MLSSSGRGFRQPSEGRLPDPNANAVLLRHRLPDGSWHFDWMFRATPDAIGLASFRVTAPIHHPETDWFDAEQLGDHRDAYLTYEGPVSGGRGDVARVVSGWVTVEAYGDESIRLTLDMPPAGPVGWIGTPVAGNLWRFVRRGTP